MAAGLPPGSGIQPAQADSASVAWVVEELSGGPRRLPNDLALALRALAEGDFDAAARLAETFLRRPLDGGYDPWKGRARLAAARAHLEAGRPSEALRLLEGGAESVPGLSAHARFLKALALERLGRHLDAAKVFDSVGGRGRLAAASLSAASRAWFQAGNCPKAASAARALEAGHPSHADVPKALLLRGRCLEAGGDRVGAVWIYHRLWLRFPLQEAAAEAERRLEDLGRRGITLPRPTTEELWRRAQSLQEARRIREALEGWRVLLGKPLASSARMEAAFYVGLDLYFLRDNENAARHLRWVADRGGTGRWGLRALYYLARVKLRQGDWEGFERSAGEVLASDPKGPWARRLLFLWARVEEDDGLLEPSLERYRLLAAGPPSAEWADEARWRVGWIHFRRGRLDEAERVFADLGRERPRAPVAQAAFFWAGRAAEGAKRPTAGSYYRSAVRLDPLSYYGQLAAERLGGGESRRGNAGSVPRFLKRPPFDRRAREVVEGAEELFLAGFFRAAAEALEDGRLDDPYFLYQRARLLYRARDYHEALRILHRPVFWPARVGLDRPPGSFWRMMYPLDRRTLEAGRAVRAASGVNPLLIHAVILAESSYDPDALSVAGARGLMQVMPGTGRRVARSLDLPPPSEEELLRPGLNVRLGGHHLGRLLAHFGGRTAPAVAAYNAGREAAEEWWRVNGHLDEASFIATIPYLETRRYVRKVLAYYRQYRLRYGEDPEGAMRGTGEAAAP